MHPGCSAFPFPASERMTESWPAPGVPEAGGSHEGSSTSSCLRVQGALSSWLETCKLPPSTTQELPKARGWCSHCGIRVSWTPGPHTALSITLLSTGDAPQA